MRFVVKLGGAALEDPEVASRCGKAIAELVSDGNQVAVVHGGGVQLTRTLAQMGKKSEFVSGLRITDAETRDAALMVLAAASISRLWRPLVRMVRRLLASQAEMAMSFARERKKRIQILALSERSPLPTHAGSTRYGRWERFPSFLRLRLGSMASTTTSTRMKWLRHVRSAPRPTHLSF